MQPMQEKGNSWRKKLKVRGKILTVTVQEIEKKA